MISFNLPLLDKNEVILTFEKPPVLKDLYMIKKWLDIATEAITEKPKSRIQAVYMETKKDGDK